MICFPEMLYSDYLEKWLEITRVKIKVTTYSFLPEHGKSKHNTLLQQEEDQA